MKLSHPAPSFSERRTNGVNTSPMEARKSCLSRMRCVVISVEKVSRPTASVIPHCRAMTRAVDRAIESESVVRKTGGRVVISNGETKSPRSLVAVQPKERIPSRMEQKRNCSNWRPGSANVFSSFFRFRTTEQKRRIGSW